MMMVTESASSVVLAVLILRTEYDRFAQHPFDQPSFPIVIGSNGARCERRIGDLFSEGVIHLDDLLELSSFRHYVSLVDLR